MPAYTAGSLKGPHKNPALDILWSCGMQPHGAAGVFLKKSRFLCAPLFRLALLLPVATCSYLCREARLFCVLGRGKARDFLL